MKGKDFKPLREETEGGSTAGPGASSLRDEVRKWWGEARSGAEHFQSVRGALPEGRIRQFFYGASLPFHIARTTLADAPTRARYLRVTCFQTAFLLALAGVWAANNFQDEEEAQAKPSARAARSLRPEAQARLDQATQDLEAALGAELHPGSAKGDTPSVGKAVSALIATAIEEGTADDATLEAAATAAGNGAKEAAERARTTSGTTPDEDVEEDAEDLGDMIAAAVLAGLEEGGGKATPDPKTQGFPIQKEPQKKGFNIETPQVHKGVFFLGSWEFWVLFFTSLSAAQWVVVALSRDYHSLISREASLATGITPEDPQLTPRVRLNFPWIKAKLQRRWRAYVLFALGLPVVAAITAPVPWRTVLFPVLSSAWAFWWLVVFTSAKSDRAWVSPVSRPPWFLRGWHAIARVLPFLRWGPFRWYEAVLTRRTEGVSSPIASVERQPWVFAGLALARFVGTLPPLRCFTRPFIPVAAAHLHSLDPQQPSKDAPRPPQDAGD
ncbi:hypothetical protein OV208_27985 [Corallococcus sp. bb12-1]|uniref:hypothetical protein n=1 Tax=Corallococcus sp. bb12-1 TaxID=2996784 RepID=UPI002272079C|nr:hypothetical protein [Corallococcus sp. bb12-1]MCY1045187.1 hypothetical protein [Corallococcus sp. bb12-1]